MFCIKCQQKTQVINSRHSNQKSQVWRRRSCGSCGYTFTTYENLATDQLTVKLKGKNQEFDSTKLLLSIANCFEHSPKERARNAKWLSESVIHKLIDKNGSTFSIEELTVTTFNTLKEFDRLATVQYSARHTKLLDAQLRHL